jgi:hypothetical protein
MKTAIFLLAPSFLVLLVVTPGIVRAQNTTTSGNTPWQEFGVFFGHIQKHTGVFHNENGVFIPWTTLCGAGTIGYTDGQQRTNYDLNTCYHGFE